MEDSPKYEVSFVAAAPSAAPTLASLLIAYQAEANAMLAAAGYPATTAQVSATMLPSGPSFSVSAADQRAAFGGNLSYGLGATPEAALNDFNARLVPAQAA